MKDRFTKIVELIHKMKRNRRGKLEVEIAQTADEVLMIPLKCLLIVSRNTIIDF